MMKAKQKWTSATVMCAVSLMSGPECVGGVGSGSSWESGWSRAEGPTGGNVSGRVEGGRPTGEEGAIMRGGTNEKRAEDKRWKELSRRAND